MPEMDGLQLIKSLRQRRGLKEIPAIALTGYVSEKDIETAIAAGFNMHLAKPLEPAELCLMVEQLLVSYRTPEP
jgi:CheY-like chemotaxis protein